MDSLTQFRTNRKGRLIWFHCASLGEFEQGRPIMEAIRRKNPDVLIALTFFSPSGYEVRKNYAGADWVGYLPNDTKSNNTKFIRILDPVASVYVKYEYWPGYFFELKKRGIPLLMVSAILRPDQRFFGLFKGFWKKVLACVDHYFVQNEETAELLGTLGFGNFTIAGDNRFDRVIEIAGKSGEIDEISTAVNGSFTIVAGSTWQEDETMLIRWIEQTKQYRTDRTFKLILVPHETDSSHIGQIQRLTTSSVLWSERHQKDLKSYPIIIIDTIGMLSSIYRYADVTYVGGGFGKGIHNTLEAAVWSKPLIFGPNIRKFEEAKNMVKLGGALVVNNYDDLKVALDRYLADEDYTKRCGETNGKYVQSNAGATEIVMQHLERKAVFKN